MGNRSLEIYHVIEPAHAVTVKFPDGREFRALVLLGYDPELDVAVLKLEATGLPAIIQKACGMGSKFWTGSSQYHSWHRWQGGTR